MNPIQLLRSQNPYAVLFLLIFSFIAKAGSLVHPQIPEPGSYPFLFAALQHVLHRVLGEEAFLYALLALVLIFSQSLHLARMVRRHQLFPQAGYLPAFLYLLWTSLHPALSQWGMPVVLASVFLFGLDALLSLYQSMRPRSDLFYSGFALGLAGLLHFPAILFLLGLVMGLMQWRRFQIREWLVALIGFITPFYFLAGLSFLFNRGDLWEQWFQAKSPGMEISMGAYEIYLLVMTALLVLASLYMAHKFMPRSNVFTTRTWVVLLLHIPMTGLVVYLDPFQNPSTAILMAAPLSLVSLHLFHAEIRKGFRNFVIYFLILFMGLAQFIWYNS